MGWVMINIYLSSLKGLGEDDGSHMFGAPMLGKKLNKTKFHRHEMFVGQFNLADFSPFDTEDLLPDEGMLYLFFDVFSRQYALFYSTEQPTVFRDGFNKPFDNFRYDNALALGLHVASDTDSEVCNQMFAPVPERIAKTLKHPQDFVCLFKFIPEIFDDLGRPFLMRTKEYSCILIHKKHLKKAKFHKAITVNY